MGLEVIVKDKWVKTLNETTRQVEEELIANITLYQQLIELKSSYDSDSKTHRIIHRMDYENNTMSYDLGTRKIIGYKQRGK